MCFEELKNRALTLPLSPGVYIMKDKVGDVIYVGKAKKLKNRVSQYFQDSASHTFKTRQMISKIDSFDVIVAASEFEALILECSLIKRHQPKYNILLKDDKGFPFLRLDMKASYPVVSMVTRIADDGAEYFGPFGSRGVTNSIVESIRSALKLPACSKKFPRDIGKDRPCLNYHMGQCDGWCQSERDQEAYRQTMIQVQQLLQGDFKTVLNSIRKQMEEESEKLNFEQAAVLRDRMAAIEKLGRKQLVTSGKMGDTDVIGYAQSGAKACFSVLHFSGGSLIDKDYEILPLSDDPEATVSSLLKQYYLSRGFAPKIILIPFDLEDRLLFEQLLEQQNGRKTRIKVPVRGDNTKLIDLAVKNAQDEVDRVTNKDERTSAALTTLGKMLSIKQPKRIESYDISNISGTDIVAGMVVFQDGKPRKGEYKRFKIKGMTNQDDYGSMFQVITRRFEHYCNSDKGFEHAPDIILIDGGVIHAQTAENALAALNLSFPVFGMVKDKKHRTRALVTADGKEIHIDSQPAVFSLIGTIQEETHRFAISYHRQLRSKRLRFSELDQIPGIGPKRKQILIKAFQSVAKISNAELQELKQILPEDAAHAVYSYFEDKRRKEEF